MIAGREVMLTDTDSGEVRAALLFDRPSLSRSTSAGAKAFLEILDLRWNRDEEVQPTALGRAAAGLKAVFSDQREVGREIFRDLASTTDDDEASILLRLMGLALLAWSSEGGDQDLVVAAAEARAYSDDHLAAMYLLKLAGFALDSGDRDHARALLSASLERAPADRELLVWRLNQIAASESGQILVVPRPQDRDPLADFPWIVEQASQASKSALEKIAEVTVADPWRRTIHFGSTPVDSITAAVLQAEWAGSLWHLPPLRRQQAAMTIIAGGRDTEEWERAVSNWVVGGGKLLHDVVRFAEAHFDSGSAQRLIDKHLIHGRRLRRPEQYTEVLLELWDLLDARLAAEVLRVVPPPLSEVRGREESRALWAVLGAVIPDVWSRYLAELAPEEQASVLPHLTVGLVEHLPESALHLLAERDVEVMRASLEGPELSGPEPFRAAVALLRAPQLSETDRTALLEYLSRTPRSYQLDLAQSAREVMTWADIPSLMRDALELAQRDAPAARQGRYTMYARSPLGRAAGLAIAFPEVEPAAAVVDSIFDLAFDSLLYVDFRIEALQASYRIALSHHFDDRLSSRAGEPTQFRDDPFRTSGSESFQRALLDCTLFISVPNTDRLTNVLAHARDGDARVRHVALQAIADNLQRGIEPIGFDRLLLWTTVVGGLFDPSPSVVEFTLGLVAAAGTVPRELLGVVSDRVGRLFSEGGRDVRSAAVRVAIRSMRVQGVSPGLIQALIQRAQSDRSWLVRSAVMDELV